MWIGRGFESKYPGGESFITGFLLYRKESYRPEQFSKQFLTNARKDGAWSPICRARLISKESLTKLGSVEASRVSPRAENP